MSDGDDPPVVVLSKRQLAAYNRADLDAFCACDHADVVVLDGATTLRGIEAFRARYGAMFAANTDVFAEVSERVATGDQVLERERWSRVARATGARSEGEVCVRYTLRDGLIGTAEFTR